MYLYFERCLPGESLCELLDNDSPSSMNRNLSRELLRSDCRKGRSPPLRVEFLRVTNACTSFFISSSVYSLFSKYLSFYSLSVLPF
jgi:hypothetical protein